MYKVPLRDGVDLIPGKSQVDKGNKSAPMMRMSCCCCSLCFVYLVWCPTMCRCVFDRCIGRGNVVVVLSSTVLQPQIHRGYWYKKLGKHGCRCIALLLLCCCLLFTVFFLFLTLFFFFHPADPQGYRQHRNQAFREPGAGEGGQAQRSGRGLPCQHPIQAQHGPGCEM